MSYPVEQDRAVDRRWLELHHASYSRIVNAQELRKQFYCVAILRISNVSTVVELCCLRLERTSTAFQGFRLPCVWSVLEMLASVAAARLKRMMLVAVRAAQVSL